MLDPAEALDPDAPSPTPSTYEHPSTWLHDGYVVQSPKNYDYDLGALAGLTLERFNALIADEVRFLEKARDRAVDAIAAAGRAL